MIAKGERDVVTDVDLAVEDAVRAFLARETPEIGVLGEEHGRSGPADDALGWALDPVDGTANLARGIPLCAVSPGLVAGRRACWPPLLNRLGARAQRIRMIGTAAIDLAWVAQGRLDASIIPANTPWDTLVGVLLVREAGGVVVDLDDTEHTADSATTIAVCAGLRPEVLRMLQESQVDPQC